MNKELLIVDLDGTIVNTLEGVLVLLETSFGIMLGPEFCKTYDVATSLWELPEVREIFRDQQAVSTFLTHACWENPEFYLGLSPYRDLFSLVKTSSIRRVDVLVLTSRPARPAIRKATETWLDKWWGRPGPMAHFADRLEGGKVGFIARQCRRGYRRVIVMDDDERLAPELAKVQYEPLFLVPRRAWTEDTTAVDPNLALPLGDN